MNRSLLSITLLVLSVLSCAIPVGTPPAATPAPSSTPAPTASPLPTLPWDHAVQTSAYVLPYALNIHEPMVDGTPGPVMDKYLYVGDRVVVLSCFGDWCDIETQIAGERVQGSVWRGCLSNVAEALLCREAE